MRVSFYMTKAQHERILNAQKADAGFSGDDHKNATLAWIELGRELGFDPATARRINGAMSKFFTAEKR